MTVGWYMECTIQIWGADKQCELVKHLGGHEIWGAVFDKGQLGGGVTFLWRASVAGQVVSGSDDKTVWE